MSQEELLMVTGETAEISATVIPSTAVNKALHWRIDDESVAMLNYAESDLVDDSELITVTATGTGTALITATTDDGGYYTTCQLTVTSDTPEVMKKTNK